MRSPELEARWTEGYVTQRQRLDAQMTIVKALAMNARDYDAAQNRMITARADAMRSVMLKAVAVAKAEILPIAKISGDPAELRADVQKTFERIERMVGECGINADAVYANSDLDRIWHYSTEAIAKRTDQKWIECSREEMEDGTRVKIFRHATKPHELAMDSDGDFIVRHIDGRILETGNIHHEEAQTGATS
jgi:hypothetical protein